MIDLVGISIISFYTTFIGAIVLFTNNSVDNISTEMRLEMNTLIR